MTGRVVPFCRLLGPCRRGGDSGQGVDLGPEPVQLRLLGRLARSCVADGIGPAVTVETAGWVAEWADGLVTVNQPAERIGRKAAEKLIKVIEGVMWVGSDTLPMRSG
jgi:hypothetical protein